ncbi:MAG: MobA/MobL family protein [Clostridia bacterium]|nr:MobA/MobL family protein [Clostridia bacterium]
MTIAIYHCSIKIISRGKGKSAVAAAAYRSGEKLTNDYDGTTHDFTRKGGVVHTEILLPDNAPREYADRSTLWNAVEAVEKSKNAQLSREIEIALPNELSEAECVALAKEFAQRTFVDKGMCADVCIHNPNREQKNIHAHIMLTMRPFNEDGTWGDKQRKEYLLDKNGNKIYDKRKRTYKCRTVQTTDWNSREKAEEWRTEWAEFLNQALVDKGLATEEELLQHRRNIKLENQEQVTSGGNGSSVTLVDHRSFERQGRLEKPTVHMGVAATQMERKGIRTVKGDTNREIKSINAKISALLKRIEVLDNELAKMKEIPKEDSLIEMLMRFHDNGIKFSEVRGVSVSNLKKIAKFKDLTHLIAFVQGNNIGTLSELAEKNSETKTKLKNYKSKLISTQKRMKELTELLDNYLRHKENKAVYLEWQSITNLKKKEKFYDKHYGEIALFKTAKSFFDSNLNGAKLTPKAWQRELDELKKSAEVDRAKVEKLGNDVAVMETLIYNVQRLTNYEEKQNEIQRRRTAELE